MPVDDAVDAFEITFQGARGSSQVLGLGTDLELRVVNGLKTLSLMVGNIVAGLIFVVVADPRWDVVVLLAAGSLVGGYVGARIGRRLPDAVFRWAVVAAGVVAAVAMF